MGIPSTLGRFAVKEQSSGFGTAETSFANANYLEAQMFVPTPTQESIQAEVMRASHFATTRVAGGKGPIEFSIAMPLHGFSTSTPSGNPSEHPDALLLRSVLGSGYRSGYNAGAVTGSDADTLTLSSDDEGLVGLAVLAPLVGSSKGIGWIKSKSVPGGTATYELQRAMSASADSSGDLLGSNTIVMDATQPTPFTLQWLGSTSNVNYSFFDAVVTSCTINMNAREQPQISFNVRAGNYSVSGSGGAPSAEALADRPQLPVVLGDNGARVVDSNGAQKVQQATLEISADVVDEINYSGQGISRFVVTKRTATLTIMAPAAASSASSVDNPASLQAPGTALGALQLDLNNTAGRAFSLLMPAGQTQAIQALSDAGGILAVTTTIEPGQYSSDSSNSGSLSGQANTALRVAFL